MKKYVLIKKPTGKRKTFQMFWDIRKIDGKRTFQKIDSLELDRINENYKSGILIIGEAFAQVLKLKEKILPKKQEDDFEDSNIQAIKKLKSQPSKKIRKKESIQANDLDYSRILKLLGKDSIVTIDISEFQSRIISSKLSPYTQNRVIIFANKLLKFVGREERLEKVDADFETLYINEDDLKKLLPNLSKLDQQITRIFFYSGLRLGELFGIKDPQNKYNVTSGELKISRQLKEDLYYDSLKRNSKRTIKIVKEIKTDFENFKNISEDFLMSYRNKYSKHLLKATRKTFKDESKHISAHDLRHSFAMYCLEKGINISQIAKLLGNSVSVCEKHYTSGASTSNFLNEIEKKMAS